MTKGLGDEIYSGAASFGKLRAVIGVIFGTIIGIGLIIGGIFALIHKTKLTEKTTGTSVDNQKPPQQIRVPTCSSTYDNNNRTFNCNFNLQYVAEKTKQPYIKSFTTSSSTDYTGNTEIDVYYDPNDPSNASLQKDDFHTVGYILIGVGVLLLISSWIYLWVVSKYKFAAAASGAAGAVNMVRLL